MSGPPGRASVFAPPRVRGSEHLDDHTLDPAVALRSLVDISRSNRLLGGTSAVLSAIRPYLVRAAGRRRTPADGNGGVLSIVDVGTGAGDIPVAVRLLASRLDIRTRTIGLDRTLPIAAAANRACGLAVAGDARQLPFADRSVDVVTCSQLLHHFADPEALMVIRELHRVARTCVVIGELRRSWIAAAGVWLLSWPLAFHRVSRHDGVVSVVRGYAGDELAALVRNAVGITPTIQHRPAYRVTAAWSVA
ncbi:MAG: methyltransferase domain-containing protein [Gemmatimonadetes bacterium]|nr:methyltransferase domain-containing protein [Gemmatimonadota bacterium]